MSGWRPATESDGLDRRRTILVLGGTLLVVVLALVAAGLVDSAPSSGPRPDRVPTLSQPPADRTLPARRARADVQDHLQRSGWVDADRGVVHVPVERVLRWAVEDGRLPARTSDPDAAGKE